MRLTRDFHIYSRKSYYIFSITGVYNIITVTKLKKPLISVIVPAYNEEKYIEKCLKSLLNQDLPESEYEIIIVDNASTDNTATIIKKYPVKLVYENKRSVVYARQKGVVESKGAIIASADADTIYPKTWLARIKNDFNKNPDAVAIAGWIYLLNTNTFFDISFALYQEFNAAIKRLIGKFPLVYAANFAFKRSVFNKIGGYPLHLPELGDQQYLLYKFNKLGPVLIDKKMSCHTSGRRHFSSLKDIFIYNGWYRMIGYLINSLFKKEVIGPAPAVRTIRNK